jgi:hypothetical protein
MAYNLVVWQGETYEYTKRNAEAADCVNEAKRLTGTVACKVGMITKIMITDAEDFCVFEWVFGEGVVFPTEEQCKEALKK